MLGLLFFFRKEIDAHGNVYGIRNGGKFKE